VSVHDTEDRPSYARYVAGLTGGLDAFPDARAKGSLVRSVLEGQPPELLRELPEPIRAIAVDPPVDSDWVPEAHVCALVHAIAERRQYGIREYCAWVRGSNRALFASPLYRILMAVVSPGALLRHAGKRWGNFHRGSTLVLDGFADDGARLTLMFPSGVYDALLLRGFGEAFAAALEAARAKDPVVEVDASGAGFARFLARW
jgi:hypothetical protein